MEQLETFLVNKRALVKEYEAFFEELEDIHFIKEPQDAQSNYWLQALLFKNKKKRDDFLKFTNEKGVMTRPIWKLMNELEMFRMCQSDNLKNARYLADCVVNIPSSVRQ